MKISKKNFMTKIKQTPQKFAEKEIHKIMAILKGALVPMNLDNELNS